MEFIVLNGSEMLTREQAHKYIARVMRFPSYYGGNLDALADCLSELGSKVYITLINFAAVRSALGEYADTMLRVFRECADEAGYHFSVN